MASVRVARGWGGGNITLKEIVPVVFACATWGSSRRGALVTAHRQHSSSDQKELWVQRGRVDNALGAMPVLHHGPFPVFPSSTPYPWEPEYVSRCHFEK